MNTDTTTTTPARDAEGEMFQALHTAAQRSVRVLLEADAQEEPDYAGAAAEVRVLLCLALGVTAGTVTLAARDPGAPDHRGSDNRKEPV